MNLYCIFICCVLLTSSAAPDWGQVRSALLEARRLIDDANALIQGDRLLEQEDTSVRLDNLLEQLNGLISSFTEHDLQNQRTSDFHQELISVSRVLRRTGERLRCHIESNKLQYRSTVIRDGSMGRPRLVITEEQLLVFQRLGFSWTAMAKLLGVSTRTVWRRVQEFGIDSRGRYSDDLTDEELDDLVQDIKSRLPEQAGTGTVLSHMRARQIVIPNGRLRVYQSLVRLDALATSRRWNAITTRRSYWVPGPGSLWHVDGNHKLIRWGIVIHGGIDGYSRLITFLQASDNNFAQTVAVAFTEATTQFGLPSRLRTDRGRENVIIGEIMETIRGEGRGSWLRGPSVHNQRIERLWRDLKIFCMNVFIDLFYRLEEQSVLLPGSAIHTFSLHYVFLNRINVALREFQLAYNNHAIRTMQNRTPYQIYMSGLMSLSNLNYLQVRELINNTVHDIDLVEYGIEPNAINNENPDDDDNVINVFRPSLDLSPENYNRLLERLHELVPDVTADCNDNGVAFYMVILVAVDRFIRSL